MILKFVWEQLSRSISTAFRILLVFPKPVLRVSKRIFFPDFLLVVHCNWCEIFHIGGIKISTQNCLEFLDGGHFVFDLVWEKLSRSLSTVLNNWLEF